MNKPPRKMPPEKFRCFRLGDLTRLLRLRCGPTLPDDDAGREYLAELLYCISLGPKAPAKMRQAIGLWVPWMGPDEAQAIVARIPNMTRRERSPTAAELGDRMRLTNSERERACLWTIAPVDANADEIREHRKALRRERMKAKRRASGVRPRGEYLAKSLSRNEPWKAEGISRRTWERRRAKADASPLPIKVDTRSHTCDTRQRRARRSPARAST